MDERERVKLQRRVVALRAKANDASVTGPEREAYRAKAKELEARIPDLCYPRVTYTGKGYQQWGADQRRPPRTPNEWLDQMRQAEEARWGDAQERYANLFFNPTNNEEDIVEEDYRYDDEDGDW